jgi:DNA-binding XRE family transcriptional regulator
MKTRTKKRLKAAGWEVGSAARFLGLTKEDRAFVQLKVALARELRRRRASKDLTQAELAKVVGSSQPRVAFMEAGEDSVSIDLLVSTLFALGMSLSELAGVIRSAGRRRAA